MATVLSSGLADPVLSTPLKIYETASNRNLTGYINFGEMDVNDVTELEIKVKVLAGDPVYESYYKQIFAGVDGGQDSPVFLIPPYPAPYGTEIWINQTAGVAKDYKWNICVP